MTNNIIRRTKTHREGSRPTHTGHYQIHRLVDVEYFRYVRSAIARETARTHTTREQKSELTEKVNPTWSDLFPGLLQKHQRDGREPKSINR